MYELVQLVTSWWIVGLAVILWPVYIVPYLIWIWIIEPLWRRWRGR